MDRQAVSATLEKGVVGLNLEVSQIDQLLDYLQLLVKWNKVYNLTAIRDPLEMVSLHLLDALTVLEHVKAKTPINLLDVGAGAGLPSIPLAICMPGLKVTAIDKVQKKTSFMQQVKAELGLANFNARHGRVELLKKEALSVNGVDVVISRAFSDLKSFVDLTKHLLADDGCWFAMKGVVPESEMETLPEYKTIVHPLTLQDKDVVRHLIEIEANKA